jgi:hypothetical protein
MSIVLINVADTQDPNDDQGRSYREVNNSKSHIIPVGSLVEIDDGVRLFVVHNGRDCDGTPLYWLSIDKNDTVKLRDGFINPGWDGGYIGESLTVVDR